MAMASPGGSALGAGRGGKRTPKPRPPPRPRKSGPKGGRRGVARDGGCHGHHPEWGDQVPRPRRHAADNPLSLPFGDPTGMVGLPRPAGSDIQSAPPELQAEGASESPPASPSASSDSAGNPDCYVESITRAPRWRRMPLTTQLRNWNDLLTDNGLVWLEAGSRARGEGNECVFLAHALSVASEGDLRGSERDRTYFPGGRAQHNKEGLCQAFETDPDWKDYFREGKYGGGLTVGRTDAQWAHHVRLRGTMGPFGPCPGQNHGPTHSGGQPRGATLCPTGLSDGIHADDSGGLVRPLGPGTTPVGSGLPLRPQGAHARRPRPPGKRPPGYARL